MYVYVPNISSNWFSISLPSSFQFCPVQVGAIDNKRTIEIRVMELDKSVRLSLLVGIVSSGWKQATLVQNIT